MEDKRPDSSLSWLLDGGMNSHWLSEQRSLSRPSNADLYEHWAGVASGIAYDEAASCVKSHKNGHVSSKYRISNISDYITASRGWEKTMSALTGNDGMPGLPPYRKKHGLGAQHLYCLSRMPVVLRYSVAHVFAKFSVCPMTSIAFR
ncbi:hypothetical protein NFI96_001554 [Prochilodus magdalenae]|nr:hypothetical protein NFI96_001554 [Prochilodus magdalenae]